MSQTRTRSVRALEQAGRTGPSRPIGAPGRPAIRRRLLVGLIWAGLAVPVLFWWQQTSGSAVLGNPALLTSAGRLAGLTGGYLLLVQVLLMSRVPVIDRAVSGARKSAWHRDLGGYVIGIISLHVLLVTLGYAGSAHSGIGHEAWTLLTTNQDMISALVAFGLMVTLSLVAIRAIRTRLPYGLWHASHACVYFVLLFVYGHQFADGQQFVLSRAARVYWATLYFVVIAAVIYGRLLAPLRAHLRYQLLIDAVTTETPGVTSIYITGRHLEKFPAIAGQYVRWRFLTRDDWWRSHPFSLSAAPNRAYLRLTVKASGDHSGRLASIGPGTRVLAEAPTGEFTADHRIRTGALLIAAGTGITPVRALLETIPSGSIVLVRARTAADLIFKAEIDKLATARKMTVRYVTGSRTDPAAVALTTPSGLRELVPDIAARDVYVCGPAALTTSIHAALLELRVPRKQIHTDPFEL